MMLASVLPSVSTLDQSSSVRRNGRYGRKGVLDMMDIEQNAILHKKTNEKSK